MRSVASEPRVTIEGGPEGLHIAIPTSRSLFLVVFLGVWLVGWAMGEVNALTQALSGRMGLPGPVLLFWLLLWTAAGLAALYVWLWRLAGKERVLLGASTLRVKQDILGFGRSRVYELRKIRRLRVVPRPAGSANRDVTARISGLAGGAIEFEYENRAIQFGSSIDETAARTIVERMTQRYAFAESPPPA
jgi:hypothetical protein